MLYALQIASSNLKRMELEKPQPEQVVTAIEQEEEWETPIAVRDDDQTAREGSPSEASASETSASATPKS
jgi:phage portal protein BeeE